MQVSAFDYHLPPELIAQHPAASREDSRLMVVNRQDGSLIHTRFGNILDWLSASDVLIINDTKVFPARLQGRKYRSGGKVEVFLLRCESGTVWEVLLGGKVKPGTAIEFGGGRLTCRVLEKGDSGKGRVEFDTQENLRERLYELGSVPLPPYIKRDEGILPTDHVRYQTVYAQHEGAVAAPTAGLHFSEELLNAIRAKGVEILPVTLHVGIGTFQPVKAARVEDHRIMPEWYHLSEHSAQRIRDALAHQQRIIMVGTTSTRLLESVYAAYRTIQAGSGWADTFIYPGFQFQVTRALITNFHLPKSSLLMLVSALGGQELLQKAYQEAIRLRYRFYSYGDAMFII